jgi:serine/threonine-protein kinase RsbW
VNGRVVLEVPAKPEFLLLARLAATGVGRSAGASEETIADLKLAVTEAVANAVRHAYPPDSPGRVSVELSADGGRLEIAVSDEGRGLGDAELTSDGPSEPGESGMGLSISRAIADEVEVGAGPDGRGTRVRFACKL